MFLIFSFLLIWNQWYLANRCGKANNVLVSNICNKLASFAFNFIPQKTTSVWKYGTFLQRPNSSSNALPQINHSNIFCLSYSMSWLPCQSSVMASVRWNLMGKKWVYLQKFVRASLISPMCIIEIIKCRLNNRQLDYGALIPWGVPFLKSRFSVHENCQVEIIGNQSGLSTYSLGTVLARSMQALPCCPHLQHLYLCFTVHTKGVKGQVQAVWWSLVHVIQN